jgi:hypothetical protein
MFVMNLNQWDLGLELKIIRNTIKEIAAEYNIFSYKALVNEFFEFLEQRYNIKLRQKVLEEKQQKQQPSISYTFRKITTTAPKTTEEQSNHLNDIIIIKMNGMDQMMMINFLLLLPSYR